MKTAYELIDKGDYWVLPLHGRFVTRCFVDSAFGIELWSKEDSFTIRIEGPFVFQETSKKYELSAEEPTKLCQVLSILNTEVSSVLAFKKGRLWIAFSDERCISVDASPSHEAWEIFGGADMRVISLPGGDLAVWGPQHGRGMEA